MTVYNPFHSIGLFSVFETDLIRSADVYTGGYNADQGGRISSVMDITYKDGNKKRFSGLVGASTFGANALIEGPIQNKNRLKAVVLLLFYPIKLLILSKVQKYFTPMLMKMACHLTILIFMEKYL